MAYPNYNSQKRPYNGGRDDSRQEAKIPDFPRDYVDFAEELMKNQCRQITTSKLRNIFSLFTDIYNTELLRTGDTLLEESLTRLQMARIRIAYESGRDRNTKEFVEAAHLLPWLKAVGNSREQAIRYIRYLEAIVAYHRFWGGREN